MDLNELFYRYQVSLVSVDRASSREARHSHRGLVSGYSARIRRLQNDAGALSPLTVICA